MGFKQYLKEAKKNKVKAPKIKTKKQALDFISKLGLNDTPDRDIIDVDSGEVLMEPGDTKYLWMKKMKKDERDYYKTVHGDATVPDIYVTDYDDENEFKDFYVVLEKPIRKLIHNPDEMQDADYDIDVVIPVGIARRDLQKMTNDDMDNIESYIKWKEEEMNSPNIKLSISGKRGDKRVQVEPRFN